MERDRESRPSNFDEYRRFKTKSYEKLSSLPQRSAIYWNSREFCAPPDQCQVEVSIVGSGFGETILIHFGDCRWAIIDSLCFPDTKEPYCLEHLKILGFDPSSHVAVILATHWHDDHIRGFELCLHELNDTLKKAYSPSRRAAIL